MRSHLTLVRMAIVKQQKIASTDEEREIVKLVHYWYECKMVQLLRKKNYGGYLKR